MKCPVPLRAALLAFAVILMAAAAPAASQPKGVPAKTPIANY